MVRHFLIATAVFASLPAAAAETNARVPVYVQADCKDDTVGQRVVYHLREAIRRSSSMSSVASLNASELVVGMVCLSPAPAEAGRLSNYAYAVKFVNYRGPYDYHLSLSVGSCGTNRVTECADTIAAALDDDMTKLIRRLADGSFMPFAP